MVKRQRQSGFLSNYDEMAGDLVTTNVVADGLNEAAVMIVNGIKTGGISNSETN